MHPFQVCPEDLTSVDSIRATLGVGLVPNLAPSLRQKPEDKTADEKNGSAQPGEDHWEFKPLFGKPFSTVGLAMTSVCEC